MVDIVTVLSLQARARRNARKSLHVLQRERALRAEAAKALAEAGVRHGGVRPRTQHAAQEA